MKLGITRAEKELTEYLPLANEKEIELIALPVIKTEPVDFTLPPDNIEWIIFTSANGVRFFFKRMNRAGFMIDKSVKIASIGAKTSEAVKNSGFDVKFESSEPSGEPFFNEFINTYRSLHPAVLFVRAERVNYDPEELFTNSNFNYVSITCYRTVENIISNETIANFSEIDSILFTAPSTVNSFSNQFGEPKTKKYAIGKTTAKKMQEIGWSDINIIEKSDIKYFLESL